MLYRWRTTASGAPYSSFDSVAVGGSPTYLLVRGSALRRSQIWSVGALSATRLRQFAPSWPRSTHERGWMSRGADAAISTACSTPITQGSSSPGPISICEMVGKSGTRRATASTASVDGSTNWRSTARPACWRSPSARQASGTSRTRSAAWTPRSGWLVAWRRSEAGRSVGSWARWLSPRAGPLVDASPSTAFCSPDMRPAAERRMRGCAIRVRPLAACSPSFRCHVPIMAGLGEQGSAACGWRRRTAERGSAGSRRCPRRPGAA